MNLYFFHTTIQVPLHGKFKTRNLLACLDPQYRIVIQCQNIVYVLNEYENVQPKIRVLKELTDSTECNINDSHNDIIQPDAILLNEGACKSGHSDQIIDNGWDQNENISRDANDERLRSPNERPTSPLGRGTFMQRVSPF